MICEIATSGYGRCSCVSHGVAAGFPRAFEWRHEDDHCAQCDGYLDPMNSEVIAVHLDGRDLIWCGKECLTPWVIAEAERRARDKSQRRDDPEPASSRRLSSAAESATTEEPR